MIYYSKTNNGFYNDKIHSTLPNDVIEITAEYHQQLLSAQSQGKMIIGNTAGYPILVDAVYVVDNKTVAQSELNKSDITITCALENHTNLLVPFVVPVEWKIYRQELRKVINSTRNDLPAKPTTYP